MESYGQPSMNSGMRSKLRREEEELRRDFRRVVEPCTSTSSSSSSDFAVPRAASQNTRQANQQKPRSRSQTNYDYYFQDVGPLENLVQSPQSQSKQVTVAEKLAVPLDTLIKPALEPYTAKWSPERVREFRQAQQDLKRTENLRKGIPDIMPISQTQIKQDLSVIDVNLLKEIPVVMPMSQNQVRRDVRRAENLEAKTIQGMAQQVRQDIERGENTANANLSEGIPATSQQIRQDIRCTDVLVDVPLPGIPPIIGPVCVPPPIVTVPVIETHESGCCGCGDMCDCCKCAPMDRCCRDCEDALCCGGCCGLGALCDCCSPSSEHHHSSCDCGYSTSVPGICEFLGFVFFLTAMIITVVPYQGGPQFACILFGTILGWVSPFIIYFTKLCLTAHQLNFCYRIYVCVHLSLAIVFGFIATVLASEESINGNLRPNDIAIAVFSGLGTAALIVDFAYNVSAYFT